MTQIISCKSCIHVATCGAFKAFAGALEQMKLNYEHLKDAPGTPESLALVCTEYKTPSMIFDIKPVSK